MNDEEEVLKEIREVLARKNWVTFDSETTSLAGEIIQWAIHDPISGITGQGLVKPTVRVMPDAYRSHKISDEMLDDALPFPQAWQILRPLLAGKEVVIYNAHFDIGRLYTSIDAYENKMDAEDARRFLQSLKTHCAMGWFAVLYGEWSDYHESYTYQSLTTACRSYNIMLPKAHQAGDDARATAELVKKMAEEEE